jgi:hypothetical protein
LQGIARTAVIQHRGNAHERHPTTETL